MRFKQLIVVNVVLIQVPFKKFEKRKQRKNKDFLASLTFLMRATPALKIEH